jgi:hypothetical protein
MPEKSFKVVQWATGYVGKTATRHFASNPAYELVGVLVTSRVPAVCAGSISGSALAMPASAP